MADPVSDVQKLNPQPGDIIVIRANVDDHLTRVKMARHIASFLPKDVKLIWLREEDSIEVVKETELAKIGLMRIPKPDFQNSSDRMALPSAGNVDRTSESTGQSTTSNPDSSAEPRQ